ncbi:MAG TPA: hypothetical protein V6D12_07035 [Candidatus Obscuribacterales bacterium]
MTTYITLETALRMLANTYLASVILLLAASYIGFAVIETMENGDDHSPKPKWFS